MSELLTQEEKFSVFRQWQKEGGTPVELIFLAAQAQLSKCEASFPARIAEERAKLLAEIENTAPFVMERPFDCDKRCKWEQYNKLMSCCHIGSCNYQKWQSIKELKI